jgi:hypothetical protein
MRLESINARKRKFSIVGSFLLSCRPCRPVQMYEQRMATGVLFLFIRTLDSGGGGSVGGGSGAEK